MHEDKFWLIIINLFLINNLFRATKLKCCCYLVQECNIEVESTILRILYPSRPIRLQIFCALVIKSRICCMVLQIVKILRIEKWGSVGGGIKFLELENWVSIPFFVFSTKTKIRQGSYFENVTRNRQLFTYCHVPICKEG